MANTELYIDAAQSALNAGGSTGAASYTSTNANWNSGTGVFTPTDGSTPASTVNVGDLASVYLDAATTAVFVGRVTAVAGGVNGAITVSLTAKAGTPPSTAATGRSIKINGAMRGPSGATTWPFNGTDWSALKNAAGDVPRFNIKGGTTYSVTSQLNMLATTGKCELEGYTTTPGDGGRATFDGGTSNIILCVIPAIQDVIFRNLIFKNNGTSGSNDLVQVNCSDCTFVNCVFGTSRGNSCNINGSANTFVECEFYGANGSNSATKAGCLVTQTIETFKRCTFHHNTSSTAANTNGFIAGAGGSSCTLIQCVFDSNSGHGFFVTATGQRHSFFECDFYNNGGSGYSQANQTTIRTRWENCNFAKNAAYGRDFGTQVFSAYSRKCGYGGASGSNTNASGNNYTATGSTFQDQEPVSYTSHPWSDPASGDFRITSSESAGQGRAAWTQTAPSYAGCAAVADIGAVWHAPVTGPPASGGGGGIIINAKVSDMEVPLDEVVYFDALTHNPVTGAVADADSTPSFEVFEESTDTDIGVGGSLTKRTSKTGNYRGSFTASGANGFELGKWYSVVVSATVNAIAGKAAAMHFRVVKAENTAGYPVADLALVEGDSGAADRLKRGLNGVTLGTASGTPSTTSIPTSSLLPACGVADQYKGKIVTFDLNTTTANLRGQSSDITANTSGGTLTVTALTTAPVAGDTFTIS